MSANTPLISLLVTEQIFDGTQDLVTEIPIDARIASTYTFSSEVTEFPVESGASITDHVHLRPDTITIEGMVTDTPVNEMPAVLGLRGDSELQSTSRRRQKAFDAIFQVWKDRIPLTVVTEYLIFDDMVIESFEVPKSPDRGEAVWFNMTLKKINKIETLSAALAPEVVARLNRRRPKSTARRRANRRAKKSDAQLSVEIKNGQVSVVPYRSADTPRALEAAAAHKR